MSGTSLQGELDIREGFEAFIDASRRLEQSYSELQSRAETIDLQLAETNRELERTLLEREMVFSSLPVGLFSLGADNEIRWRNAEGERLQGLATRAREELVGFDEGDRDIKGTSIRVRRVGMPDGGTLLLVEDRSQLVNLEREVDRLDRLAGLSELALGIAHEIKNPLNGVMGFAALLQRTDDGERKKDYAKKIGCGLEQVDSIVKALLAFARPSEGRLRMSPLQQVINESCASAGIPTSRVSMTFSGACDSMFKVEASALTRVLSNLFLNSAEAKKGDVKIRVHVDLADRLTLTVADDGPGVPRDVADKIFQPFYSTKDRGHGLGLALACRVLSFLDGKLELLNPGEPGARFRVTSPAHIGSNSEVCSGI